MEWRLKGQHLSLLYTLIQEQMTATFRGLCKRSLQLGNSVSYSVKNGSSWRYLSLGFYSQVTETSVCHFTTKENLQAVLCLNVTDAIWPGTSGRKAIRSETILVFRVQVWSTGPVKYHKVPKFTALPFLHVQNETNSCSSYTILLIIIIICSALNCLGLIRVSSAPCQGSLVSPHIILMPT